MRTDFVEAAFAQVQETRTVFSVAIAVFRCAEAIDFLSARLASRSPTRIAFANANLLNMAYGDSDLSRLLNGFVILNDGTGVNLASRVLYGSPFPENLNGTDFCPAFFDRHEIPLRIFLLGGRPDIVERAAGVVAARWPMHVVAGYHHGYFNRRESVGIRERIALSRSDVVLVAMGNGRQERIVDELVPACAPLGLGVGALFDFLAGEVSRAPSPLRKVGAEWLYRLAVEPGRLWRRYLLGNPVFLWRVLLQRLVSQ